MISIDHIWWYHDYLFELVCHSSCTLRRSSTIFFVFRQNQKWCLRVQPGKALKVLRQKSTASWIGEEQLCHSSEDSSYWVLVHRPTEQPTNESMDHAITKGESSPFVIWDANMLCFTCMFATVYSLCIYLLHHLYKTMSRLGFSAHFLKFWEAVLTPRPWEEHCVIPSPALHGFGQRFCCQSSFKNCVRLYRHQSSPSQNCNSHTVWLCINVHAHKTHIKSHEHIRQYFQTVLNHEIMLVDYTYMPYKSLSVDVASPVEGLQQHRQWNFKRWLKFAFYLPSNVAPQR